MENLGLIGLVLFFIALYFAPILYRYIKLRNKMLNNDEKNINGYVYIISNTLYKENILKIGMTTHKDYNKRIKELYNTSVPLPFNIELIIPHKYPQEFEKFLHKKFKKYRVSQRREFFLMDVKTIRKELEGMNFT